MTTSTATRVGANVKAELARRGITQAQLAEQLGISNPSMTGRLQGKIPLDVNELEQIASYLDTTTATLLV